MNWYGYESPWRIEEREGEFAIFSANGVLIGNTSSYLIARYMLAIPDIHKMARLGASIAEVTE